MLKGFFSRKAAPEAGTVPHPLDVIRFGPERSLLTELQDRFGLEQVITHLLESGEVRPFHELFLAQQLRLTPLLAPRVFRLLDLVRGRLGFSESTDLYVVPQPSINAVALHRLSDEEPHAIGITSEMIKSMNDDELCFALGHEIGHLHFRHYRVKIVYRIMNGKHQEGEGKDNRRIPQLLERRLDSWGRLAELSADRAGFLGAGSSLQAGVSAFFKMASGLGPEHLNFEMGAFLSQLERLQKMERPEVMATFSHPVTPVRARALQLYAGLGPNPAPDSLRALDSDLGSLTSLMDFELSSELGSHARQFLVAGGLLAAHADGEASADEQEAIIHLLLQVTGDPETHIRGVADAEQARRMLDEACAWLTANAGEERFTLFGQLAHIVALDGQITGEERTFMLSVAARLGIPERAAKEALHEVLSSYVQTKKTAWSGAFGFGA